MDRDERSPCSLLRRLATLGFFLRLGPPAEVEARLVLLLLADLRISD